MKSERKRKKLYQDLLLENGLRMETWTASNWKNLFQCISLGIHLNSQQEEFYRQKNLKYVKNNEPEFFAAKKGLQSLQIEENYLEYLRDPDLFVFEKVRSVLFLKLFVRFKLDFRQSNFLGQDS